MGVSARVSEGVYGNDIAVKPDLQPPLSAAYWVVCFAEWLSEVGITGAAPDQQLDTLGHASQYVLGWRVCVCVGWFRATRRPEPLQFSHQNHVETEYPALC